MVVFEFYCHLFSNFLSNLNFFYVVEIRVRVRVTFRVRVKVRVSLDLASELGLRLGLDLWLHFLGIFSRRIMCMVNISGCRYSSHTAKVPVTGTIYTAMLDCKAAGLTGTGN